MPNNFKIPQINPLKFYWQSDVLNTGAGYLVTGYKAFDPNQNERGMDHDFFVRNIKSYMEQCNYFQPFQQGDKIELQWLGVKDYTIGPTIAYTVAILDKDGNTVKQVNSLEGAEVGAGSGVYIRSATLHLYDVPEGCYFVQIQKVGIFTDFHFYAISEGIDVRKYHANTMLFRYSHRKNAYGVFWETGIEMWLRLHAAFETNPASTFSVYDDQTKNLTMLSGVKYRDKLLALGIDRAPTPEYIMDKFEEVSLCSNLYIDHALHTRAEGSKLELGRIDKNPLLTANINMREKNSDATLVISEFPPIVIADAPEGDWFYVHRMHQTTPSTDHVIQLPFNGAVNFVNYLNSTNFLDIVDYVNTYFALDELNRIVLVTNDSAVFGDYSPGLSLTHVLEGYLLVEVHTTDTETDLDVAYVNSITMPTKYAYFWGDGSAGSINVAGATSATVNKTYAADKKFIAYLFWDRIHNLYLDGSDQIIKTIEGKLPNRLIGFNCENNQLKYIKNNIFSDMGGFADNIQITGGKLGKFAQDDIIRFVFEAMSQFTSPATVDMQSQVPAIAPSGDPGLSTLKTATLADGITIYHD